MDFKIPLVRGRSADRRRAWVVFGARAPRVMVVYAMVLCMCVEAVVLVPSVGAQTRTRAVMLRIRPHVGDTLRMQMEQRVEMSGDSAHGAAVSGPPMVGTMCVYTSSIVERVTQKATELTSTTDSVNVTPAAAASILLFAQTKRALERKTIRVYVARNGGITVRNAAGQSGLMLIQLPAMLPEKPVRSGAVWTRELNVPLSATHESNGHVRATFRLDSLGPEDIIAYISVRATFRHTHPKADDRVLHDETTGTITGTMQVDRRLEWMTHSWTTVTLLSTVHQPGAAVPTRVHMKVTQSMRAMPRQ